MRREVRSVLCWCTVAACCLGQDEGRVFLATPETVAIYEFNWAWMF